jgi:non-specific serine/threonine protein kinase
LESAARHNLKSPASSFIGRQADLERLNEFLINEDCRLVTLVGTGGIGKTRLATRAAFQVLERFPEGVWMIELASLTEGRLLPQRVAEIFGVSAQEARQGQGETEVLIDYLQDKQLLLVIDNCEHLVEACARFIDRLLNGCPRLKVMTTSREDLRIPGENLYHLEPLDLPAQDDSIDIFQASDAIRLFVERAKAARQDFELSPQNCAVVFQICQHLDGIPLAIELAAARIRMLTPDQIAQRLDNRFSLLTAGMRTALPRHQTLEAALDWSFNLLSEKEQALLCRLSVYSGGFTFEALAAQYEEDGVLQVELFDLVTQLVDKSLVLVDEREDSQRYKILETIRQYGIQKLVEMGELDNKRLAHLAFYLELAEPHDSDLRGAQQLASLAVLDAEHDNLRSALRWSINQGRADLALRLVGTLGWYWFMRGFWNESSEWVTRCLSLDTDAFPLMKAKAIYRAGGLDIIRGKLTGKQELVNEALQICRDENSLEGIAWCLNLLGQCGTWGELEADTAEEYLNESIQVFNEIGDQWGVAWSTRYLGQIQDIKGDYEQCIDLQLRAIDIFAMIGDIWNMAHSLYLIGVSYLIYRDYKNARWALESSLEKCQIVQDKVMAAHALRVLGLLALEQDQLDEADKHFRVALVGLQKIGDLNCASRVQQGQGEVYLLRNDFTKSAEKLRQSLEGFQELGTEMPICTVLAKVALLADRVGDNRTAALLLGFVDKNLIEGYLDVPAFKEEHELLVMSARKNLGSELFQQLWIEGKGLKLESAVQLAMEMQVD